MRAVPKSCQTRRGDSGVTLPGKVKGASHLSAAAPAARRWAEGICASVFGQQGFSLPTAALTWKYWGELFVYCQNAVGEMGSEKVDL